MPENGFFIPLYNEATLKLYLNRGVYGQLMPPVYGDPSSHSRHYHILADYATGRRDNHIFFFLERTIVYGGQLLGLNTHGAFFINGKYSPMGRKANSPLVWDESLRSCYTATKKKGIFEFNGDELCQPFLIRFKDNLGLVGKYISSDDLYFELSAYPYPLPSNAISGTGFCSITPGETDILLKLLNKSINRYSLETEEEVNLQEEPVAFDPNYSIEDFDDVLYESHLEAAVIANPELLPLEMRPGKSSICRQVPISPFKPAQMDRADICYYDKKTSTIPHTILELKFAKANSYAINQVIRYSRWLRRLHDSYGIETQDTKIFLYAPGFTRNAVIPIEYRDHIQIRFARLNH